MPVAGNPEHIDDILIYSNSKKEHNQHVRKVLQRLREAGLQADISKCEFHVTEVNYLGLIIGINGIRMDPKKIRTIVDWERPECIKDVQAFIGFANFYRRFIKDFSKLVTPLIKTIRKDVAFSWSSDCQKAFDLLKNAFTSAPILAHFDYEKESIVETDASDNVSAGILSQYGDDGLLHPVAFFSKKHTAQEINYEIYDKELLAIIRAFEQWRPELEGSGLPIKILTDHRNLEYYMTTKQLSRRQARWSEYLSRFNFVIMYRPGKMSAKPDALTRRSGDLPKRGDERLKQQLQTVLKPHNLEPTAYDRSEDATEDLLRNDSHDLAVSPLELNEDTADSEDDSTDAPTLEELITQGYGEDPLPNRVLEALRTEETQSKDLSLADCKEVDGRLYYRDRLFVPQHHPLQMRLCRLYHDSSLGGHLGNANTYELLQRNYYWPNMQKFVNRYVSHCHTCKRSKGSRFKKQGVLKPLPVPNQRWTDISIDFVTGIPEVDGQNAICNVVCRLTKERHHIATITELNAEGVADLFVKHIWKHHGLPRSIISDRGTQFVNDFWQFLCKRLGIESRLSTAWHPETDGQTERINGVMEQYLRAFVNCLQDDWVRWLPLAEFVGNNTVSSTTKVSPFFANKGFHPRMGFEPMDTPKPNKKELAADEFATRMEELQEVLRNHMLIAQASYEHYANKARSPAPLYKIGDMVMLDARNIVTKRPSRKLENKRLGPYKVKRVVSTHSVELDLPVDIQIHPVFHVNLLEPMPSEPPHVGHLQDPPPPVKVDGEEEWEVDQIVDSRYLGRRKRLQYRLTWKGYNEVQWEDCSFADNAPIAKQEFHRRHPNKPGPQEYGART